MKDFREYLLQEPTPISSHLWMLAEEYYERTERFDALFCTGMFWRDGRMPMTQLERQRSARNAMDVMRTIKYHNPDLDVAAFDHARRAYCESSAHADLIQRLAAERGMQVEKMRWPA